MTIAPQQAPRPEWAEVVAWHDLGQPAITPDGTCWLIPEQ